MYISSETMWNMARMIVGILALTGIIGGLLACYRDIRDDDGEA